MSPSRPFPIVHGGCTCGLVRYQLNAAPLFCYACHCVDCQKSSGSVFAASAVTEFDRVLCISKTRPKLINYEQHGNTRAFATCPKCHCALWHCGSWEPWIYNIHIGTLDLPQMFEPDLHIYVEGKVDWVRLPEGARTVRGDMDRVTMWPKSSLVRLEACMKRWEAGKQGGEEEARDGSMAAVYEGESGPGDKTPTNGSPELVGKKVDEDEDEDGEFERRHDEIEKALEERLEKLSLKLDQETKS